MFRGVVPFEAFGQPPGFGRWKRLVERRLGMDVEVVLDQDNGLGMRESGVGQSLKT